MATELRGKTAIITGASSGIGAAIAQALAAHGVTLVLAGRHEEPLQAVVRNLPEETESLVIPADVGNEEDVERMVAETVARFGHIDILINNAGKGLFKPVTELTSEEFDDVIRVNLRGTFLCTKYVLPKFYAQGHGDVVTISSLAGKHGFANGGAYCASKFGVMGLMESMFHEVRERNVRIITLTPGSVDTPFFDKVDMTPPNRERILQPEDVAGTVLTALNLPRRALLRELDIRPANPRGSN